ncbi:MAG: HlyD family efflux transporter periplasmic adaptor subunit [Candidatus Marinimicrobia bacterium]|jgi:multidrug efflux pump subunit AcrA (membrane-fusion protein)|nr:HlyD family efflux transporter periplasmic adaptor subunit [Candidatus Neomarinimicrobiota bacterium]MBT3576943.1 HlyD family efflux transporter periplasmic adaptor subunit [Candidatus Neomarinimicrobiota bacterium]MBT3681396.1 HlyD family efflux transporter periplasmic adaptor subunit [Candidatus Neomarinimicrobiota bacterium]MBT3951258.1 HlyD family efflux transporter periplasmic adaptor subunit [Candidatus Neomarinimicrobiota bacterium]MBT4254402.1 HlyD family efflux transporter periplasm
MKRKALILSPLVLLVGGFIIMKILFSFKAEKPKRNSQITPRIVATSVVSLGEVPAKLTTYGTLASSQPVTLISEVSGTLQAGDIAFQPAQSFKRGDLLLKVDNRQINLELNSTKSDLLTALSSLMPEIKVSSPKIFQVWQQYFDSINFDEPIGELPTTQDQRLKALLARYNIFKLYFAVQNLEIRASKHFFYAPFNGSIISTQLRDGSTAAPGSRLGELINLEKLEVEIQVPAKDIGWIHEGSPVILEPEENGIQWIGHIERIGNIIDERSQSVLAYIKLDDTGDVNPLAGVFVKADIEARMIPDAIKVSRRAVYEESYVFLINGGVFEKRPVGVAFDEGDYYIINRGLTASDTLVTELLQGVSAGMPARSRNAFESKE